MLEFLTRLKTKKAETDISARAQWLGLVQAVADGNEPSEDATLDLLQSLGRTVDQLTAAVELVKQRRQWKAEMDAVPVAKAEIAKCKAERDAATIEVDAAIKRHNDRVEPLAAREQAALVVIASADVARERLGGTSTDQTLKDRVEKATEAVKPIQPRLDQKMAARGDYLRDLKRYEDDGDTENAERVRGWIAELTAEINTLNSENQRLQAEMSAAQAEALEVMSID